MIGQLSKKRKLVFPFSIIFLLSMVLAACGGGDTNVEAGSDSTSKSEIGLDLSHVWPPSHDQETVAVKDFIADVEEATDGKVKITSYPGSALAASDGQFDAVATGAVDIGMSVNSYNPNQFPLTSVMELLFMSDNGEKGTKILWQLSEEFPDFDDEYAGTVPLWFFISDPGQIFTVGKPVKSIEDLKGMRIRSPSAETNERLTNLGATPVSMPMNETDEALERGVVDGTIAPWEALLGHSLIDVVDYATVGNFYSTTFYITMNENSWDSLGEENQTIIENLIGEKSSMKAGALFDQAGQSAIEQSKEKGIEIYELSEEELTEWKGLIDPTIEKWIEKLEERGLPGQAIYDRALELSAQ